MMENVLITGASSGIGRALALAYAARGAHVVVAARRRQRLDELAHQIGGEALELDVSDGDACFAAVRALDDRLRLDVVVANAGIGGITPGRKLAWERVRDSASKAGLITFLESLRVDLHGSGVSVTTVCPGYVQTELLTPGKSHPFVVAADEAARIIAAAADAREAMCTFPAPIVAGMRAAQLLPRPLYEFIASRSNVKY